MAMSYTSLTAAKGTTGAIANWVNYSKLDIGTIVDEAQAAIYMTLRTREMRTKFTFNMPIGNSFIALPTNFLDPIGKLYSPSINRTYGQKDENYILVNRNYDETSGTLGANPLTTSVGSTQVTVNLPSHGFNQESSINLSGATAVGGITPNGTFDIVTIVDPNDFIIDTLTQTATSTVSGGGSGISYLCDNLVPGISNYWAIWDEEIHFDSAFLQAMNCQLQYYRSLPLLSNSNQTNFLTTRYPQLMRTACVAAAADFMKDDVEYQKGMARLQAMTQQVSIENDMSYRGIEIDTETP
jgi:hypothetical protein